VTWFFLEQLADTFFLKAGFLKAGERSGRHRTGLMTRGKQTPGRRGAQVQQITRRRD
jgi:hypothetical protein